jgi:molecular chaperone DnaJ
VQDHPLFRRDGTHLFCEIPVTFPQAALGATLDIPTLDGDKAKLTVPEGTQSGSVIRLRGQGVPQLGGRGRGDLHVLVRVEVPTRLDAEQRKLVQQLAETLPPAEIEGKEKSLFERMKDIFG